jgi:hypothetical protein
MPAPEDLKGVFLLLDRDGEEIATPYEAPEVLRVGSIDELAANAEPIPVYFVDLVEEN